MMIVIMMMVMEKQHIANVVNMPGSRPRNRGSSGA
jgi:hypothetical protein